MAAAIQLGRLVERCWIYIENDEMQLTMCPDILVHNLPNNAVGDAVVAAVDEVDGVFGIVVVVVVAMVPEIDPDAQVVVAVVAGGGKQVEKPARRDVFDAVDEGENRGHNSVYDSGEFDTAAPDCKLFGPYLIVLLEVYTIDWLALNARHCVWKDWQISVYSVDQ